MTNGTLTSFLDQNNETLRLHDRLLLLRDIASGLNYLHTFSLRQDGHTDLNPVVHGDLTGVTSIIYSIPRILTSSYKTNVLIDGDRKAYLADFGLSGTFKKLTGMTYLAKLTCHPGAVRWAAPELLSGEESTSVATTQSDMYSFGNIMLQVLTGNVPWYHLTRDFQISYQVIIEGKMQPRPKDAYVTDRYWNFMTRCWSMTITDRPPAKEVVQFVGSALNMSTSTQSPTSSISSDEQHLGIARNDYPRVLSVIQDHRLGWGESTNLGLTVTQTSQPQFASLDEAFSQNQYDNAAAPSASTNVSTQLWRQPQGADYPHAPPHHVSHAAASHAHHAPAPVVGPSTWWALASDTLPQYSQFPLPAPHSQPHAYPYNSSSVAPYHGQQNQPVPTELAGLGLASRDSKLDERWTSFVRDAVGYRTQ
ncbi:kinase-like protein [Suillus brevipes Sb2]|nr:kinase-like protein [Suillus brevipes Sb2]